MGRILCRLGLHRDEWVHVKFLDDWRWLNCYACRRCRRVRWELTGTEAFLKLLESGKRPLPTNEKNYGPKREVLEGGDLKVAATAGSRSVRL